MDVTKVEIPVSRETATILSAMKYNSSGGLKVIYRSGRKVLEVYAETKGDVISCEDIVSRKSDYCYTDKISRDDLFDLDLH